MDREPIGQGETGQLEYHLVICCVLSVCLSGVEMAIERFLT